MRQGTRDHLRRMADLLGAFDSPGMAARLRANADADPDDMRVGTGLDLETYSEARDRLRAAYNMAPGTDWQVLTCTYSQSGIHLFGVNHCATDRADRLFYWGGHWGAGPFDTDRYDWNSCTFRGPTEPWAPASEAEVAA